jgi:hypothetical protein
MITEILLVAVSLMLIATAAAFYRMGNRLSLELATALAAKAVSDAAAREYAIQIGRLKAEAVRLSKERPGSPVAPPAPKRTVRRKGAK